MQGWGMGNKKTARRIVEYAAVLFVLITLNFALPRMMPGDPFLHITGDSDEIFTEYSLEQVEYYRSYYGLDKPLHEQYVKYLGELLRGDLGYSYYYKENVNTIIKNRFPWTLFLAGSALALSLILGTLLGTYSAWRRDSWQDRWLYTGLIIFSEIPVFLIGLLFLVIFGATLGWFPLSGSQTHFITYHSFGEKITDIVRHAVLPVTTLAIARTGNIYLLVRNSLGSVLTRDYMRTARAKGLSEWRIRYVHALKNALLPLVTRVAAQIGGLAGGAILAENVFAYPGLGTLMRSAVTVRDYPLLQGVFLVLAISVIAANILADLLYKKIDPRISEES